ncbi:MAG: AI-2E family transporter [Pseudomonadota bacterium]
MRFDRLMEQLVGVFALLVLAGGALLVTAPFMTALLWGAILTYSTWGPYKRLTAALGGRRFWAALLIVLVILLVFLGPIFYAVFTFSAHAPDIAELLRRRLAEGLPPLPEWLTRVPLAGPRVDEAWNEIAARNPEMVARMREYAGPVLRSVLELALALMHGLVLLALSVVFAFFFYLSGENAATGLLAGMRRVAGERAGYLLGMIGGTVKGVVYGILGTSLAQGILCAVGYWLAGLPSPALLGLATFFLAVVPGGPLLILVPGAIWLVQTGQGGWAVFLIVWGLVVSFLTDNVLKPMLIGKTSDVPFILVMIGVLGGALAFGLLGVFIGPTLLAVANAILRDWATEASARLDMQPVAVDPVPPARQERA